MKIIQPTIHTKVDVRYSDGHEEAFYLPFELRTLAGEPLNDRDGRVWFLGSNHIARVRFTFVDPEVNDVHQA